MNSLVSRRAFGIGLVAIATAMCWLLDVALKVGLHRAEVVSGLALFVVVLFLACFNARKKLPFLPLLKASTWMQMHLYAGLFSIVLFLVHLGFKPPRGPLEVTLAAVFAIVAVSGLFGLAISRWLPRQLTVHGENLIFERIPALRASVRKEVEELVLHSITATNSSTLADLYERELRAYFERPRHLIGHLIGSAKPLQHQLAAVEALDRYLNDDERKILAQLTELIRAKDNLDFQLAGQGLLKAWLFVHIPFTYSLLVLAAVHGMLAWKFS